MAKFLIILVLVALVIWGLAYVVKVGVAKTNRELAKADRQSDDLEDAMGGGQVRVLTRAKSVASEAEIASIRTAFAQYYLTFNRFPTSIDEMIEKKLLDRNALADPWFQEYRYELQETKLIITSPGPDRIKNTGDDVHKEIPLQ